MRGQCLLQKNSFGSVHPNTFGLFRIPICVQLIQEVCKSPHFVLSSFMHNLERIVAYAVIVLPTMLHCQQTCLTVEKIVYPTLVLYDN